MMFPTGLIKTDWGFWVFQGGEKSPTQQKEERVLDMEEVMKLSMFLWL